MTRRKLASDPVEGVHSYMNLASARRLGNRVQAVARETISHVFATTFVTQPRKKLKMMTCLTKTTPMKNMSRKNLSAGCVQAQEEKLM